MTAYRTRRRSAAYAALAIGLSGTLALTGCSGNAKKSRSKSQKQTSSSAGSSSSSSSSSKSKKRRIIGGGAGVGAGAASRAAGTCIPTADSLRFFQKASPSHVVVEFTNRSGSPCKLYDAPALRFGAAKEPLGFLEGGPSMVGHSVALRPRGHAWASIPTTTAATRGTKQTFATVEFLGNGLHGAHRGPARVDFPGGPVSVGPAAKVTDWQVSLTKAELKSGSAG
ncbi:MULTISPECIES: DUF4232 domain-containing protein [Streptomyces]|uniref:DUF4232 domain-containing protein n=1 Tax=Streptomyces TaxID=1883 RepID=UPI00069C5C8E|nr:DUF4232 domain-containing protein [Streptomyces sp. SID7805]MYU54934.1 DUF4232 domain-containing protein [Streptomyces sp. SID7805]